MRNCVGKFKVKKKMEREVRSFRERWQKRERG